MSEWRWERWRKNDMAELLMWTARWTTNDEIMWMRDLALRGKWRQLAAVAGLIRQRRWDAGVDVEQLVAEAERLLREGCRG